MEQKLEILKAVIEARRTVKPAMMNGTKIENAVINQLLELATWAPTHGKTEPWHFEIYTGESLKTFCQDHAEMYKATAQAFVEGTYLNLKNMGNNASHLLVSICKRGNLDKIPLLEEIAATSAAIQNILLGAESLGISSFWSTGGMTLKPAMKSYFNLGEEDTVMGLLYLGYSDVKPGGSRNKSISEIANWH
ncbi:nitroreductase family protein [Polluticaenibacter yanchengensis]|uniref:Putative NAD(P)H nitroreductase n=1 Tax=Polluticaenibacter yanchengensis TaxID=3014562 RepID=A0ABT4UKS9_9BACT|nr:nitroreductase [Chitinophagaceae bacterium LY-5]